MPHKPTAVIADDQTSFLSIVRRLLANQYDIVATAQDGVELMKAITQYRPDLIVTDISMPLMTGFEAVEATRSLDSLKVPSDMTRAVVFLTIHADEILVRRAFAVGALGYVLKPRAALDLLPAVEEARRGNKFVSSPLGGADWEIEDPGLSDGG